MFAYCTQALHLSEPEAALRIRVARVSRRHPVVLEMLRDGKVHLSGIALLAPLLTRKNGAVLPKRATHKSKRQIEEMIAELRPTPAAPPLVRRLPRRVPPGGERLTDAVELATACQTRISDPEQRPDAVAFVSAAYVKTSGDEPHPEAGARADPDSCLPMVAGRSTAPPVRRATVEPVGPARFRVRFDASAELRDKLERLQALMRSSVPDGDLALVCRVHNALLAERDFGKEKMALYRRRASRGSEAVDVVGAGSGTRGLRAQWRSTG